tara:strand:+ start:141 stop:2387 length:2247 start_codon:yes stop_codon:yes gene_type:complete
MRVRSAVIVLMFIGSILSGCTGDDTENGERVEALEAELSDKIVELDEVYANYSMMEEALNLAVSEKELLEQAMEIARNNVTLMESERDSLYQQLDLALTLLNQSEGNITEIYEHISELNTMIEQKESDIESQNSTIALLLIDILELEQTIYALESTIQSVTYSLDYIVRNCPLGNPGFVLNIGFDNGEGAGLEGDGILAGDEVLRTVGECPGNTGMVYNETTTENNWGPQRMVQMGGILYFTADDGVHGWELWRSDGTLDGTYMILDILGEDCEPAVDPETGEQYQDCTNPGSVRNWAWGDAAPGFFTEIVAGNEKIFFTGFNGPKSTNFADVWVSDGTAEGTHVVDDIWIDWDYFCDGCEFYYSGPRDLMVVPSNGNQPDRVVFSAIKAIANTGDQGFPKGEELWISDGTQVGTRMLANIEPETSSFGSSNEYCCADFDGSIPRDMALKGSQIWFTAQTESYGRELYRFGLQLGGGLFLVKDINPGIETSNPMYLTHGSGGLYLSADDGINGQELHFSLGDAFTTNLVKDIWPGVNNSSNPKHFTKFGNKLVFSADDGANGREIWITDNTEEGTYMIKDINPGNNSSNPSGFYGGSAASSANDEGKDNPDMQVYNGEVYFIADDGVHGKELWKTDGTEEGTVMLKDIAQGNNSSIWFTGGLAVKEWTAIHQGMLYFVADDFIHGPELWRTDGTSEGTLMVADYNNGSDGSWPWQFNSVGDKLYFSLWDGDQRQLWFYWDNPGPIISV